ncbi:SMR domain-containing protein At5g58720-like [Carex rostrata]
MNPSKKKPKNRKTKPPKTESTPTTDPDLHQSSSRSPLVPTQTLTCTSQSRSSDLAWLHDVFTSLSVDQIESAYTEAGCDTFKAAGILGTHLEVEQEDQHNKEPTVSENSSQKKAKKARPRHVVVSSGMVSGVIGKEYTGSHSESNDKIQRDVEEAEGFLCSMLGENSDLGMGVVRDILGLCRGDVEKALELLLELSDQSYCTQIRKRFIPAPNNSFNYSHIFHGMDCKNPPGNNITPKQFGDRASSWSNFPLERRESGLIFERAKNDTHPMEPTQSKPEIGKDVLESLFNIHEVPHLRSYASGNMDWRKIAKNLQNGQDFEFHSKAMSATRHNPKNGDGYLELKSAQQNWELNSMAMSATRQKPKYGKGDGYHEFRTVAQQNWDLMKKYYQRAAVEYSRGSRSHASCLAEKGNYYRDLARAEDERASLEIFGARNQTIKNTVTIDLHGQHVKQAIGILKRHLLSFACIPSVNYLRVITGCGENGVGKGKMKRSVKSLATRENIEWSEENSGTIILKIEGRKEYSFTDSDCGEE